ncbi:MAG TPA: hypothetical protein VGL18_10255 [Actinomycetota bacterium]|jgi:hypothetical protein
MPFPGPDWVARDRYRLLSVSFNVYVTDPVMAESIRWLLGGFRLPLGEATYSVEIYPLHGDQGNEWPLYRCVIGGVVQTESWYGHDLVGAALQGIYELVPKATRDFLLLHAGAVVRGGAALLLPGPPNSGKSSITLELLRTGDFAYLSDEHGAIDPVTTRAYPFQRPIRFDQDALGLFPGLEGQLADRREMPVRLMWRFVRAEDVGAEVARPAEVRWIVLPTRDWDGPPRLTPVSSAQAVAEMARNCFNMHVYGVRGVYLLARVAGDAKAFRLAGGTPRERAALLAERLR